MNFSLSFGFLLFTLVAAACGKATDARPADRDSALDTRNGGPPVASIESDLARFRVGIPTVDSLPYATDTRGVMHRLLRALETSDTAGVRDLAMSRAEFAYLYYPGHGQSVVPYELSPQMMWYQQTAANEKGARRLLDRLGGHKLSYRGFTCGDSVKVSTRASEIRGCTIEYADSDGTVRRNRFFTALLVVDGRYKLLGYGEDF